MSIWRGLALRKNDLEPLQAAFPYNPNILCGRLFFSAAPGA